MKRGQHAIGLVLLGIVAIIAIIGLVLLISRPSSAYVPRPASPLIISTQTLNWYTLVGFTHNSGNLGWCMQQSVSNGGFKEALNGETPNCLTVSSQIVPEDVYPLFTQASQGQGFATACFTSFNQAQPRVCTGGI